MAHFFGVLAVVTCLASFQFKTRSNIIIGNLISRLLYILQYIFLGAFEGVVFDLCGFVFSVVAKYKTKPFIANNIKIIVISINLILLAIGFMMYKNIFSLFAMIAVILEIMALWLTKEKNIRLLSLLSTPFWFAYNLASSAYGSVVGNVLVMISIGLAIIRLDLKKGENL